MRLKAVRDIGALDYSLVCEHLARVMYLNVEPTRDTFWTIGSGESRCIGTAGTTIRIAERLEVHVRLYYVASGDLYLVLFANAVFNADCCYSVGVVGSKQYYIV